MSQIQRPKKKPLQFPNDRSKIIILILICLIALALSSIALAETADYTLSWWTVDGGGGASGGGDFVVAGTIGQPDAGELMSGAPYSMQGGFWPGFDVIPVPPPDDNFIYLPVALR